MYWILCKRKRVCVCMRVKKRECVKIPNIRIGIFVARQKQEQKNLLTAITFLVEKKSFKQSNNKKNKRPFSLLGIFCYTWPCWLFLYKETKQNNNRHTCTNWFPANFKTFLFVKKSYEKVYFHKDQIFLSLV